MATRPDARPVLGVGPAVSDRPGRYLHPSANHVISRREAARLQSFPDWYVFEGTKIQIARQIGNAVPPLLGRSIAEYVFDHAFTDTLSG